MTPAGRRICVLSAPGDRRDEDIRAIAQVAAHAQFDQYICRRDDSLRGRADDEVPRMLVEELKAHGIDETCITMIVDEQAAIDAALGMARAGDLLLIFADALARGWKQIVNFHPDEAARVVPVPRPARSVPRQEVQEAAPADDPAPAKTASVPAGVIVAPSRWNEAVEDARYVRDERGVILAPEAGD